MFHSMLIFSPPITFLGINQNYFPFLLTDKTCFQSLFNHEDMNEIIRHLPICHVEAPGQHEGAKTLPTSSVP